MLDRGSLAGSQTFNRLVASYGSVDGSPNKMRLLQFAVEPPNEVFLLQNEGWNELEYSKDLQRRWRWTTGRAETFVNSAGKDVMLTMAGESPLRYFDSAPTVV